VHYIPSLVCQTVGVTQEIIDCMLQKIQCMRYYLNTAHGDACTFYDCGSDIFQGLCQGNGAASALWLLISSFLLRFLKHKGCGIQTTSALSRYTLSYVALLYVDDGNFPTFSTIAHESKISVARRHQETVTLWSQSLHATFGALTPSKYFCYPINWQ